MKVNEKVQILINSSCSSSRKATKFCDENKVDYYTTHVAKESLSRTQIEDILDRTDGEYEEVLKKTKKDKELLMILAELQKCKKKKGKNKELEEVLVSKLADIIQGNQVLLKTPILLQGDKFLVGFNEDEIRTFLPKDVKRALRRQLYQMLAV